MPTATALGYDPDRTNLSNMDTSLRLTFSSSHPLTVLRPKKLVTAYNHRHVVFTWPAHFSWDPDAAVCACRARVAVYTISLLCETGLICTHVIYWRMLHYSRGFAPGPGPMGDPHILFHPTDSAAAQVAVGTAINSVMFAANIWGLRSSLRYLKRLWRQMGTVACFKGSTATPPDAPASVDARLLLARAQSLHAWRALEHDSLCINGETHIADLVRMDDLPPRSSPLDATLHWSEQMIALEELQRQHSIHLPRGFSFLVRASESCSFHAPQSTSLRQSRISLDTRSSSLPSIRDSIDRGVANTVTEFSSGHASCSPATFKLCKRDRQSSSVWVEVHPTSTDVADLAWNRAPMYRSGTAPVRMGEASGVRNGDTQCALHCLDALQTVEQNTGTE